MLLAESKVEASKEAENKLFEQNARPVLKETAAKVESSRSDNITEPAAESKVEASEEKQELLRSNMSDDMLKSKLEEINALLELKSQETGEMVNSEQEDDSPGIK